MHDLDAMDAIMYIGPPNYSQYRALIDDYIYIEIRKPQNQIGLK